MPVKYSSKRIILLADGGGGVWLGAGRGAGGLPGAPRQSPKDLFLSISWIYLLGNFGKKI